MDDAFGKIVAALAVILVVMYDWPRAIAGIFAGIAIRWSGISRPLVAIVAAVVAIAALGELIYPLIGRTEGASWNSFGVGIVAAGATAYGLFRWLFDMVQN